MRVILFQSRFEPTIAAETKDTTIRPKRKDGKPNARPGERVSLRVWKGKPYRSKQREICQRVVKFVFPVIVSAHGIYRPDLSARPRLDSKKVARADGFANWLEMRQWFAANHGLPFEGFLIHWTK
jgi:hypothetical protein